jgi:hypothetical protein
VLGALIILAACALEERPQSSPNEPLYRARMAAMVADRNRDGAPIGLRVTWPYENDESKIRLDLPSHGEQGAPIAWNPQKYRHGAQAYALGVQADFIEIRAQCGYTREEANQCTVYAYDAQGREIVRAYPRKHPGWPLSLFHAL